MCKNSFNLPFDEAPSKAPLTSFQSDMIQVTIPVDMIQDLGWNEGDVLRIGLDDNNITIHRDKQK
ncbi:MAG: AbrB/MazE/SpoVT family DNA-binding domain-containing protein [Thermoproteota archaeon]|nr:AbrB/MazE/SpoVT family DNA-binding domain-containing protein [Thermoproteota archaeon]